uniref:Uncharacterized protein n=1 Tax=Rhipicephalus zambeziensis TaxID=60191 RepID=A0A224YI99_9ACAR
MVTMKLLTLYCMVYCVLAKNDIIRIPKFPPCCRKPPCDYGEKYTCLFGVGRQKIACVPLSMSTKGMKYYWEDLCRTGLTCRMVQKDYVCRCTKGSSSSIKLKGW